MPEQRQPSTPASSCDILLVDDDDGSRDALATILQDEGYRVTAAATAHEAWRLLEAGLAPRVIILDLFLPMMDGWDFRTRQKKHPQFASIPVIAVSGAGKLVDAPFSLRKPLDVNELLRILTSLR